MTASKGGSRAGPVVFRGPPDRLTTLFELDTLGLDAEALGRPEVSLEGLPRQPLRVRPVREAAPQAARVRLRLPRSTPPGTYQGSALIGDTSVPIAVEVEARPRLQAHPSRLSIEATPGAEVRAAVTLVNTGNVPCEFPARSTFCVFDGKGVDHAFWVALATDPPEGTRRIDLLLDDLAKSHGGLVEVSVEEQGASIPPGESQQVTLVLRFSDRVGAGRSYAGTWDLPGLRLPIRVTVPEKSRAGAKR